MELDIGGEKGQKGSRKLVRWFWVSNILEVNSHEPHRTFPDVAAHEGMTQDPMGRDFSL